jgi:Uma2 family endonuclease
MEQTAMTAWRWARKDYDRLVELGAFEGCPIELIDGQLVVAEPHGAYHASGISRVEYAVRAVLPGGWIVRTQLPVSLDEASEPEPDLVVVPGRPGDYADGHPAHPALAIEVAESSLAFDRLHKGSLYARAGIRDYWIVDLVGRVLEVYRDPGPDPSATCGWRYRSVIVLRAGDGVAPLAWPSRRLAVADLLP